MTEQPSKTDAGKDKRERFEERFIRGGGPGGQKINKTSVVVVLRDPKTGIEVRCDEERSQSRNRARVRELLTAKIAEQKAAKQAAAKDAREKERRRRRQKSRAQKAKMVEEKRRHGAKKALRRRVEEE